MNDKNAFLFPPVEEDFGDTSIHRSCEMPKTHEMIESWYLKKEDVGRGTLATVTQFERQNVALEDQPEKLRWLMYFKELDKPLVLNSTNIQLCEAAFGSDDTDDWIGRQIVLYNDPNVSMRGKLVGGIRVRAMRTQAVAQRHDGRPLPPPPPPPVDPSHPFANMDDDIPF